jgi:hypothetical protein
MTLQTSAPIERISAQPRSYTLTHYVFHAGNGKLDLDAPYQRGHVWGLARRRNLMRSVLMGLPFGSITVNNRLKATRYLDTTQAVVDGKQRITTLLMWVRDEFACPASWFPPEDVLVTEETPDGPYVRCSGLRHGATRFENTQVPTLEAELDFIEQEQDLFDLINFGGVPQGARDEED